VPDKTPLATLDGITLNALTDVGVLQQVGVHAPVWNIEVSTNREVKINENVVLKMGEHEFKRLIVLRTEAGRAPFTYSVTLTDRRWRWPAVWVERDYNVRMPVGTNVDKGPRDENHLLVPELAYNRYTLKGEKARWTYKEVLVDVLEQMGIADYYVLDAPDIPVEDLRIKSYGHVALRQVLDLAPQLQVTQDPNGTITVFDSTDWDPKDALSYLKENQVSPRGQYPRLVNNELVRPIRVEVLFEVEPELRTAFREGTQEHVPILNVIEVPDFELTLANGQRVAQGTYVQVDDYLAALALQERPHSESPVITQDLIRESFLSGFRFTKALFHVPGGGTDPLWNARFDRLLRDWRQLFRVTTEWRHRLAHLRAIRATIVDRPTGNRGVSEAFADYVVRPSWRGFARNRSQRHDQGYAIRGWNDALESAKAGPFKVTIEDELAGLIRITPRVDPYFEADQVAPGYVSDYNIPNQAFGYSYQLKEGLYALWERVTLDDNWKLDAVVTATAQTPNDTRRLFSRPVDPSMLAHIFPRLGTCDGPVQYLRVPASLMTARVRWTDERGPQILKCLKDGQWGSIPLHNQEHVDNVALAMAAAFYAPLVDRLDGTVDYKGVVGEGLYGNGTRALVALEPDGTLRRRSSFNAANPGPDLFAYLPKVTQDLISKRLYDEGR
jgi:hypothetical protein